MTTTVDRYEGRATRGIRFVLAALLLIGGVVTGVVLLGLAWALVAIVQ